MRITRASEPLVPLLFREANPMPIKHCFWRRGLIRSPQCRLPLTRVSRELAEELDRALPAGAGYEPDANDRRRRRTQTRIISRR